MKTLIIGTGNLGHVLAGVISNKGYKVGVLSRSSEKWSSRIRVIDLSEREYVGDVEIVTSLKEQLPTFTNIILCVPGNAIEENLIAIRPYLHPQAKIGTVFSSTGFFWIAKKVLGENASLYGFERVPYMSKVLEYGSLAKITGYKTEHKVYFSMNVQEKQALIDFYEDILELSISEVGHYLEASLTNSNPLLHTARLYGLFKDYTSDTVYPEPPFFYKGWTLEDSELLIKMDEELHRVVNKLDLPAYTLKTSLAHYDSINAQELTDKINSIPAFQEVRMPMVQTERGFQPNLTHRFFEEDFPFGLVIIKSIAILVGEDTPYIDIVLSHFQSMMGKTYYIGNTEGNNYIASAGLSNFGINTSLDLIQYLN